MRTLPHETVIKAGFGMRHAIECANLHTYLKICTRAI